MSRDIHDLDGLTRKYLPFGASYFGIVSIYQPGGNI
jgi:hypothetical protein